MMTSHDLPILDAVSESDQPQNTPTHEECFSELSMIAVQLRTLSRYFYLERAQTPTDPILDEAQWGVELMLENLAGQIETVAKNIEQLNDAE